MTNPRRDSSDSGGSHAGDPRREPIYQAILGVLVVSVLVGALLTLSGEALFGSRALATAGLGMAVVCGALYWVFRLLGRRATRRRNGG